MKTIDIHLLLTIKGFGDAKVRRILTYAKEKNVFSIEDLKLSKPFSDIDIQKVEALKQNMDKEATSKKLNNYQVISFFDLGYPDILKESTKPPLLLYCLGDIGLLENSCVAVIGTRNNSDVGLNNTIKAVNTLVNKNETIVSGLAKGIDSIAHNTCLKANGKTIAVLPYIDEIYPKSNKDLSNKILEQGGLLVSENKPNTPFHKSALVSRDRIQSGLSHSLFVIETSTKGGSMHAVRDILKLSRPLFAPNDLGEFVEISSIEDFLNSDIIIKSKQKENNSS